MEKTVFKKKRMESGLTKSDMANALGIDIRKYKMIEKGQINVSKELFDKFNEICNRGANINKLEQLSLQERANAFWEEVRKKENKEFILYNKMIEFNINTYKDLGLLLGYSGGAAISHYLHGDENASAEFKRRLYNFFSNELNKQEPKNEEVMKVRHKKAVNYNANTKKKQIVFNGDESEDYVRLLNWYKDFDFVAYMKERGLTIDDVIRQSGIPKTSCRCMLLKQTTKPVEYNLKKMYDFIDSRKEEKMVNINAIKSNYKEKVEIVTIEIEKLEREIESKKKSLEIYKEVLFEIEKL